MGIPKTVRSYVCGSWHEAADGFRVVVNHSTEEIVAQVSSQGVDFGAVVTYAQEEGYRGLQALNFAERGGRLKAIAKVLR